MGYKLRRICLMETRRLILVIGTIFTMALLVQYFQRPYGNAISSLLSMSHVQGQIPGNFTASNSLQNSSALGDRADFDDDGLNSTYATTVQEVGNRDKISDGKEHLDELEEDIDPVYESLSDNFLDLNKKATEEKLEKVDSLEPVRVGASEHNNSVENVSRDNISSSYASLLVINESIAAVPAASLPSALPQLSSPSPLTSSKDVDTKSRTPMVSGNSFISSVDKDSATTFQSTGKSKPLKDNVAPSGNSSSAANAPAAKKKSEKPMPAVVSISEINDMLLQSRASLHSLKPRWSSPVDQQLLYAKSQIENAPIIRNDRNAPLYRNVSMFMRSYELMEQTLKVYIYKEGEKPIFHLPLLKGIYASEGWFMKQLEGNKHYVTKKPRTAHLFYLPFSTRMLEVTLYVPNSHNRKNLMQCLEDYLNLVVSKYSFWNRTGGADHFLVACHDWAPSETRRLMANCIRALCNSDTKEGFNFGRDVSLPETYVRFPQNPLRAVGGKPPSQRKILAFFAGSMHGYLRPILLQHWENKDPDMKIVGKMPKVKGQMNYIQHMKSSKYCICAKGFEVNSPRVVEAIFYECVPVIVSDNYVPPLFEVLNWESFSVFVLEKDIPNLKTILLSIPKKRYLEMQRRVKQVQKHFLWNPRPVKYDIFHMILHSIWYNRVFQMRPR